MAIRHVTVAEVECQRCKKTLLVKKWTDARDHGWAVPADGHLQLCPLCTEYRRGELMATAIPIQEAPRQEPG